MKWTNNTGLPEWVVKAVTAQTYIRPGGVDYTVTELISPPLQRRLLRDHDHEIEMDVSDQGHRLIGTAVHEFFEKHGATSTTLHEERLKQTIEVPGYGAFAVSGATDAVEDIFVAEGATVWDVKTCKGFAIQIERGWAKDEWTQQLNVLGWMWEMEGFPVEKLGVIGGVKDWSRLKVFERDYPLHSMVKVPVPRWTAGEVIAWIQDRIRLHEDAKRASAVEDIPLCGDGYMGSDNRWHGGETWQKRPGWAIGKPGGKCLKLADTKAEAADYMARKGWSEPTYQATKRDGERIRCSDPLFCAVRQWCSRGRTIIEAERARAAAGSQEESS